MPQIISTSAGSPLADAVLSAAQPPVASASDRLDAIRARLRDARNKSNWTAALAAAREEREFLHDYPRAILDVARVQADAGDVDGSLRTLDELVRMGQATGQPASLPEFAAVRSKPGFAGIDQRMQANLAPVSAASTAVTLTDADLLPEDIDFDPASQRYFVTSVRENKIVTIDSSGTLRDFAHSPSHWSMMAIKIDAKRNIVWATEAALDGMSFVSRADWGKSALLGFDLHSASLQHRYEAPHGAALADMLLTPHGDVIVSDGQRGGVYRLAAGGAALERIDAGDFISPQTPAMHPDGKHVFMPDYLRGIAVLDPATKHASWLSGGGRFTLSGIDGLYYDSGKLIAVQNGASPERVVVFTLDAAFTHVTSQTIIERSTTTLGDPTHGVVHQGAFYYIANSGWDLLDEHGNLQSGAKPTPARIMRAGI